MTSYMWYLPTYNKYWSNEGKLKSHICDLFLYVYLTNFDHHLLDTTTLQFCDLDLTFKVIQVHWL